MKAKEILAIAEKYATSKGEYTEFNNMYLGFRQYNGIADSVRMSLIYLYGINITKKILGEE